MKLVDTYTVQEGFRYPDVVLSAGDIESRGGHYGYCLDCDAYTKVIGQYWSLRLPLPGSDTIFNFCNDRNERGGRLFCAFLVCEFVPGWMEYPKWRFRWWWGLRNPEVVA